MNIKLTPKLKDYEISHRAGLLLSRETIEQLKENYGLTMALPVVDATPNSAINSKDVVYDTKLFGKHWTIRPSEITHYFSLDYNDILGINEYGIHLNDGTLITEADFCTDGWNDFLYCYCDNENN